MKKNILLQFIIWYDWETSKKIWFVWKNFLKFNLKFFSVLPLLQTLFAPWRRYRWSYGKGFNFGIYFQVFFSNLISRALGAFLRSILISIGLLVELFILAIGIFAIIGWLILPCLLVFTLINEYWILSSLMVVILLKPLSFFYRSRIKTSYIKRGLNKSISNPEITSLINRFSPKTAEIIYRTIKKIGDRGGSNALFYYLLCLVPKLRFVFLRAMLDIKTIKKELKAGIKENLESNGIEETILRANSISQEKEYITHGDLLIALSEINPIFKKYLMNNDIKSKDVENLTWWLERIQNQIYKGKRFWDYENLLKLGSMGRSWAAGYTLALDQYSTDLTDVLRKKDDIQAIGYEQEIGKIEMALSREGLNNVLLIGEQDAGIENIIYSLASRALSGRSMQGINYQRIVELDLISLLSQAQTQENASQILENVFNEARTAKNIILVINNISQFISTEQKAGTMDISPILAKHLRASDFKLIATCSFSNFHKYIEKKPGLVNFFHQVKAEEITAQEAILNLTNIVPFFEKKYKKFISYQCLRDVVKLSDKYLTNQSFPKKAIDLLDETMVFVLSQTKDKIILPKHVAQIVSKKTKIPIGELGGQEKQKLLRLEELIHEKIINQNEAVKQISEAMRRARADITIRKGPIGAFLFLGPTGVGKTETSKALAEIYFNDIERMIRIDMSEFQSKEDIPRLIGGNEYQGILTVKARQNPFSLILLDEIEKAHPDILNLFLQVIDEGYITDGFGRKTSFTNNIIIATSNAGYKVILEAIEDKVNWSTVREKLLDYFFDQGIFRPEFINRFDSIVIFRPLNKQNLLDISELMLSKLKKNLALKYIELEITDELKQKIVELGYNPMFGAREMQRVIQDKVENTLAKAMLAEELEKGSKISLDSNFQIIRI